MRRGCGVHPSTRLDWWRAMEGFFTTLVVGGAAVVTARAPSAEQRSWYAVIRALSLLAAILGLAALGTGFALSEWLTVSWACGLSSCCLALTLPLGLRTWSQRSATIAVLTLSTIGVVLCVEGLAPDAPWVISQAFADVTYRGSTRWVILGNGLLNLTALLITAQRAR